MTINLRQVRSRRRDLLRALGVETRRLREDAGLSQAVIARAAGISPSHLSYVEAGLREPSLEVLLRLGAVLGADLSIRYFPVTGPRIRDRHQLAMAEAVLPLVRAAWHARPEVPVYRPVRGIIDLVLDHRTQPTTLATELQSELRRVEQQVRWANQKADALAALPELEDRSVSRLLIVRNTHAMREVVRAAEATLGAAYPANAEEAVASLRGYAQWPGPAVAWMRIDEGRATLLDGPPRGVHLGRSSGATPQHDP